MPVERYHLAELAIARDPEDPRHCNPPFFSPDCRVLDVGCGAGQTLIASYGDRHAFGVDIDPNALRFGRTLSSQVAFAGAAAEQLPFRDCSFDGKRYESFQTSSGMQRALTVAGFVRISLSRQNHFVVTAEAGVRQPSRGELTTSPS